MTGAGVTGAACVLWEWSAGSATGVTLDPVRAVCRAEEHLPVGQVARVGKVAVVAGSTVSGGLTYRYEVRPEGWSGIRDESGVHWTATGEPR
jgi:hypothetical protein